MLKKLLLILALYFPFVTWMSHHMEQVKKRLEEALGNNKRSKVVVEEEWTLGL